MYTRERRVSMALCVHNVLMLEAKPDTERRDYSSTTSVHNGKGGERFGPCKQASLEHSGNSEQSTGGARSRFLESLKGTEESLWGQRRRTEYPCACVL
jgi:hypothetical protein